MCTALSIQSKEGKCFFGRNMDLAYNFNQSVMIIPRNYKYEDKVTGNMVTNKRAIIGMGTVIDNHPAMADAMNENGLACAGLNFDGYAYFEEEPILGKLNIAPYDFIQWVLSNHETVEEVKKEIKNLELVNIPINKNTPVSKLHWMISDKSGKSIVVEKTKNNFSVYDNPVGVMANNPTFDWHLTNLNEYMNITPTQPRETKWSEKNLKALGVGAGTLGIPGDFASVSRFIRIAYIRANMPSVEGDKKSISQFFNMLDYVKMVRGGVITEEGIEDSTIYSSCMDQEKGIYYYRTYDNNRINAVDMTKEELEGEEIKTFSYLSEQDVNYQN
ncbi:choloylglycine hydrolase [Clostridium collagenovorans DSM 3089]|uniref:choloylglycine hydrolase n=1 Tax=Clostridium collagenovorans DSM 3089 TaxID=1121306 RepID=A0A1M5SGJ7_9CLOT|nr:choloylglycine hydrolase [Clostridium collagenovorans]SHH37418.1 choloylglycine hydrolase [Clostridium collagenovorans DSM 3089]